MKPDFKKIKKTVQERIDALPEFIPEQSGQYSEDLVEIVKNHNGITYSIESATLADVLNEYKGGLAIVRLVDPVTDEVQLVPLTINNAKQKINDCNKEEQIHTIQDLINNPTPSSLSNLSQEQIDALVAALLARKNA